MFLTPAFIIYFVIEQAINLISPMMRPVVDALGLEQILGMPGRIVVALSGLLILAFMAGACARTRLGQNLLRWIEQGMAVTLPQFSVYQKIAHSFDGSNSEEIPVVLVATDAGWQLGVLLAPPEDNWYSVFLPGSPGLGSGSISYAHIDHIHPVQLSGPELWSIIRSRGAFSAKICAELESLRAAGKLARP
jgi:uncharacterized membrane protein